MRSGLIGVKVVASEAIYQRVHSLLDNACQSRSPVQFTLQEATLDELAQAIRLNNSDDLWIYEYSKSDYPERFLSSSFNGLVLVHEADLETAFSHGAEVCSLLVEEISPPLLRETLRHLLQRQSQSAQLREILIRNNQMASAINNLKTGVTISDPKQPGNPLVFTNPGFRVMTGYSSEEILGRNLRFLSGPQTDNTTLLEIRNALNNGQPFSDVLRTYRKDGSTFWCEVNISPIFDDAGQISSFIALHNDVSGRVEAEEALRHSEVRFRSLIENALDVITILDATGNVLYESPSVFRVLGYQPEELTGRSVFDLMVPTALPYAQAKFEKLLAKPGSTVSWQIPFFHKNGSHVILEGSGSNLLHDPTIHGIIANSRDVTERTRAEAEKKRLATQVEAQRQRLDDVLSNVPGMVWEMAVLPDGTFPLTFINDYVETMLGYTVEECLNMLDFRPCIYPEDVPAVEQDMQQLLLNGDSGIYQFRWLAKDGTSLWAEAHCKVTRDEEGNAIGLSGVTMDISERKSSEEKLLRNAFFDNLTGLPNRSLFMDRLQRVVEHSKRYNKYSAAVLFLDLDRFKMVNESLGHFKGDRLLVEVARRLQGCLRQSDTVARLGGDEFSILLDETNGMHSAVHVAERIHEVLAEPFVIDGNELTTSASIGIALSDVRYNDPEDLLRDADTAMYRAKALGKSCHEVFDIGMHDQAVGLLRMENDLRRALQRQELRVHYQPIVEINEGKITGFEALVRWQHPEHGLINPAKFIALAEETGLIVPLGEWVLAEACRQMSVWHQQLPDMSHLTISVNLSSKQFSQSNLIPSIERVLETSGLNSSRLKLEITESILMENAELATSMLRQIKEMDVQLSMDDFGTGYSSLSYLHRFPMDILKVDRSFISRMEDKNEETEIVRTIITMAQNLGLHVTAEGVETHAQWEQLKHLGCHSAQGYLFSRPLDSTKATSFLNTRFA